MPISLIAGLGNPGLKFRNTRHNIGRAAVEALAGRLGAEFKEESRWKARVARCGLQRIGSRTFREHRFSAAIHRTQDAIRHSLIQPFS